MRDAVSPWGEIAARVIKFPHRNQQALWRHYAHRDCHPQELLPATYALAPASLIPATMANHSKVSAVLECACQLRPSTPPSVGIVWRLAPTPTHKTGCSEASTAAVIASRRRSPQRDSDADWAVMVGHRLSLLLRYSWLELPVVVQPKAYTTAQVTDDDVGTL
jgi:hypothetical protein